MAPETRIPPQIRFGQDGPPPEPDNDNLRLMHEWVTPAEFMQWLPHPRGDAARAGGGRRTLALPDPPAPPRHPRRDGTLRRVASRRRTAPSVPCLPVPAAAHGPATGPDPGRRRRARSGTAAANSAAWRIAPIGDLAGGGQVRLRSALLAVHAVGIGDLAGRELLRLAHEAISPCVGLKRVPGSCDWIESGKALAPRPARRGLAGRRRGRNHPAIGSATLSIAALVASRTALAVAAAWSKKLSCCGFGSFMAMPFHRGKRDGPPIPPNAGGGA